MPVCAPREGTSGSASYLSSHMPWLSSSWGPRSLPAQNKEKSLSLCLGKFVLATSDTLWSQSFSLWEAYSKTAPSQWVPGWTAAIRPEITLDWDNWAVLALLS